MNIIPLTMLYQFLQYSPISLHTQRSDLKFKFRDASKRLIQMVSMKTTDHQQLAKFILDQMRARLGVLTLQIDCAQLKTLVYFTFTLRQVFPMEAPAILQSNRLNIPPTKSALFA